MKKSLLIQFANTYGLTKRESELVDCLLGGQCDNKGLAIRLGVSEFTVKNHVDNILKKTRMRSKTELLAFFVKALFNFYEKAKFFIRIPRILIIDDTKEICEMIHAFFVRRGCEAFYFDRIESDLVEWVGQEKIDLIISDVYLPHTTGFDLMNQLKARYRLVPTSLLITGDRNLDREKVLLTGAYDLVYKPIELKKLFSLSIEALLNSTMLSSARRRTSQELEIEIAGKIRAITSNISEGGFFVCFPEPAMMRLTEEYDFKLAIPQRSPIIGRARVVWHRLISEINRPSGAGFEFTNIQIEDKAFLSEYVKSNNILSFLPIQWKSTEG